MYMYLFREAEYQTPQLETMYIQDVLIYVSFVWNHQILELYFHICSHIRLIIVIILFFFLILGTPTMAICSRSHLCLKNATVCHLLHPRLFGSMRGPALIQLQVIIMFRHQRPCQWQIYIKYTRNIL